MFLLNSRALLVTIGYDFHHSQVLFRSYNSNWPNSLNRYNTMAIGYSPRRPDAVIGTGSRAPIHKFDVAVFMDPIHTRRPQQVRLCQLCNMLRQMTCFRSHKSCHTGKKSLPLGAHGTVNNTYRRRNAREVTQCLTYSLSLCAIAGFGEIRTD